MQFTLKDEHRFDQQPPVSESRVVALAACVKAAVSSVVDCVKSFTTGFDETSGRVAASILIVLIDMSLPLTARLHGVGVVVGGKPRRVTRKLCGEKRKTEKKDNNLQMVFPAVNSG